MTGVWQSDAADLPRRAQSGVFVGSIHGPWQLRGRMRSEKDRYVFRAWNAAECQAGMLEFLDVHRRDADAQERFVRRRNAMLELRHPCILELLDYGDEPLPFLVDVRAGMGSLRDNAALFAADLWRALRMARDVALGLSVAHRAGFIHRDIKPDNIHLISLGHAAIGGFDVAHDPKSKTITRIGQRIGSRPFAPPESFDGTPSLAFDVFSLGAVLHDTLSPGSSTPAPPYALRKTYVPLATSRTAAALAAVDAVLETMLRLSASERLQSMDEVIAQLDGLIAELFGGRGS